METDPTKAFLNFRLYRRVRHWRDRRRLSKQKEEKRLIKRSLKGESDFLICRICILQLFLQVRSYFLYYSNLIRTIKSKPCSHWRCWLSIWNKMIFWETPFNIDHFSASTHSVDFSLNSHNEYARYWICIIFKMPC